MTVKEQTPAGKEPGSTEGQARHGYRNEVNWEGGSGRHQEPPLGHGQLKGRQPYSNQGKHETPSPAAAEDYPEGNRAERSGQNLDQLERVKTRP